MRNCLVRRLRWLRPSCARQPCELPVTELRPGSCTMMGPASRWLAFTGGQEQAVGRDCNAVSPEPLGIEGSQFFTRVRVPELHRTPGAPKPLAVGRERHPEYEPSFMSPRSISRFCSPVLTSFGWTLARFEHSPHSPAASRLESGEKARHCTYHSPCSAPGAGSSSANFVPPLNFSFWTSQSLTPGVGRSPAWAAGLCYFG